LGRDFGFKKAKRGSIAEGVGKKKEIANVKGKKRFLGRGEDISGSFRCIWKKWSLIEPGGERNCYL